MKFRHVIGVIAFTLASFTTAAFAADRVFVPMGGSNVIKVIDPAKDKVISEIAGVPAVHGLAATPDGRYLVAGRFDEVPKGTEVLARPDTVTNEEHAAHHKMRTADEKNSAEMVSFVTVLDPKTGKIIRRVEVPGAVHHVATSPDSRFAAVTHPNAGRVSILDLGTFEVIRTITTGGLPNYVAFTPDAGRLFVSNSDKNTIIEIDTQRWAFTRRLSVGASPEHLVLSKDGKTLYVNNVDGGTVSVIDTATLTETKKISIGSVLHGLDISQDGKTLFVADLGGEFLVVVDLETGKRRSVRLSPQPYHLAFIDGSSKLYVSSVDRSQLWVVDAETLEVLRSIPVGGKGHQIVITPNS